jgi:hypothetical protein
LLLGNGEQQRAKHGCGHVTRDRRRAEKPGVVDLLKEGLRRLPGLVRTWASSVLAHDGHLLCLGFIGDRTAAFSDLL